MNTIAFQQDENKGSRYWLSFKYSASEDAKISIYYCANQFTTPEGTPSYFTIAPELPAASIKKVSQGNGQKFNDEDA